MIKNQYFSTKKEMQDYVFYVMQNIFYYVGYDSQNVEIKSFRFELNQFFIDDVHYGKSKRKQLNYIFSISFFERPIKVGIIYLPNRKKIEFQYDKKLAIYSGIKIPNKRIFDYDFSHDYWICQERWKINHSHLADCKVKKIIYNIIYTELTSFITQKPYFK
jgi:hypothetical protein